MKRFDCTAVERHLWSYVDRELAASDLAAVSSHLRNCEECRSLYLERAREANHYRRTFLGSPFGEKFVDKLLKRMRQEGLLERKPASRRQASAWHVRLWPRRRWHRALTVAAMVIFVPAVVTVGFLLNRPPLSLVGRFEAKGGAVQLARFEQKRGAAEKGDLGPGDSFEVPPGVSLVLALEASEQQGSLLRLEGPARFRIDSKTTKSDFCAHLERGFLRAEVAPRDPIHEPFVVDTPQAVATVIGTVFTLEVEPGMKTRLTVERGVVAFRSSRASPERGSVKARRAEGAWWVADGETEVFWEAGEPEPPAAGGAKPAGVEAEAGPQATEPVAQEPRTEGAPQVESEAPGASASPETSIPPQRNADVDNLDQPVKVEKTKRTNSP